MRADEGPKQEEAKKTRRSERKRQGEPEEVDAEVQDEGSRRRWSTKMAEQTEGQDKPLCPHEGPHGPAATDPVVSVSYFANPAIIFYCSPSLPYSLSTRFPPSCQGPRMEGPSVPHFFVISLFGPSILSTSFSLSVSLSLGEAT